MRTRFVAAWARMQWGVYAFLALNALVAIVYLALHVWRDHQLLHGMQRYVHTHPPAKPAVASSPAPDPPRK